jgi:glucose-6-phosphate 1-dehydrogenase
VVEKPGGHDLESARALATELDRFIDESQLYRIDAPGRVAMPDGVP